MSFSRKRGGREILEKETLPPAKEADQQSEAEPDEAHHGQDL
jgi:hypothetical protein